VDDFKRNVLKLAMRQVVAHDGDGEIGFVRPFVASDFESNLSFIDYAVIPPGHSIGLHRHGDNEEVYFIVEGTGVMTTNGVEHRVEQGDLVVNRRYWEHGLRNDSERVLKLLVWEVAFA
jgi:quercetin dioxygenase-like cupin family protein